ncbi:hypothetical protein M4951_15240 [Blastopirellula sp. J2-11]|uniref:hypothetical protein n=1 Tax=Blastopirellula sp. J2-11 TaxID=2943192 RepID=UPI0021C7D53F|nr:hypothetical protein [Blastopirellula sp. J2-11]UUO04740.1 hypothetical protein M4951_15240 [Blastopirellula sp. J2-11]
MYQKAFRITAVLAGILATGFLGGCSRGPEMFTVIGVVTLDGTPLQDGFVVFSPKVGAANGAASGKIKDGSYTLECIAGEKSVTVFGRTASKVTVPIHYLDGHSDLFADVSAEGSNEYNFELTTKKLRRSRR